MYDGVRKAPHRWGTSAATIERRTDMHEQLIKEIQKMVRDGEVPAKSVAEAVGKPYSTLMREINPYDKGAKLGVDAAGTAEFVPHTCFEASVSYGEYEKIVREMPKYGVTNVSTVFEADVKLVMSAENTNFERFAAFLSDYTAGRVKCIVTGSCFGKAGGGEQV